MTAPMALGVETKKVSGRERIAICERCGFTGISSEFPMERRLDRSTNARTCPKCRSERIESYTRSEMWFKEVWPEKLMRCPQGSDFINSEGRMIELKDNVLTDRQGREFKKTISKDSLRPYLVVIVEKDIFVFELRDCLSPPDTLTISSGSAKGGVSSDE